MTVLTLTPLAATSITLSPVSSAAIIHVLTSDEYGAAYSFGNTPGSFGFAGAGSPADVYAPFVVYQRWGYLTPNANILKTTQSAFFLSTYHGPTTDDAMAGLYCLTAVKNTGTPFTQSTIGVISGEFNTQVEGGNIVTCPVVGVGVRVRVNDTAHADTVEFIHLSHSGQTGTGTIGDGYGIRQSEAIGATNSWAFYGVDRIQSETSLMMRGSPGDTGSFQVNYVGNGGSPNVFTFIKNPDAKDYVTVQIRAAASQTQNLTQWMDADQNVRAAISVAGFFLADGAGFHVRSAGVDQMFLDPTGLRWVAAELEQTTVGAAGGASALPATPTKFLKVKDSAGTTLVIPAYASA